MSGSEGGVGKRASCALLLPYELRGELLLGLPEVLARVDLLVDRGDEFVLSDFKTSRGAWSEDHVAEAAPRITGSS
jgi:hypothetical protein